MTTLKQCEYENMNADIAINTLTTVTRQRSSS